MRIVVVTGQRPHMLQLCKKLDKHNIVACFHFKDYRETETEEVLNNKKEKLTKKFGKGYADSHFEASFPKIPWPVELQAGYDESDDYFDDDSNYGKISSKDIHLRDDINSLETIDMIKEYNPDVIICHGGPIYTNDFIKSFKLVLNYHSGISPVYNGAHSHMFAFANKQPHLCGGTLMVMNNNIDGGDILGHYLPKLNSNDTPGKIFIQNMEGLVKLYDSFLTYYKKHKKFQSIPQKLPPIHYYNCDQWNFSHLNKTKWNINNNIIKNYIRDEKIIEYWSCKTPKESEQVFGLTMNNLIFNI